MLLTHVQRNNRLVWNAATNTMNELFEDVWSNKPETHLKNLLDVTVRVALIILSIAGFGKEMNWKNESEKSSTRTNPLNPTSSPTKSGVVRRNESDKHTMTFTESLVLISTHITMNIVVPDWLKVLTKQTRLVRRAGRELGVSRYHLH